MYTFLKKLPYGVVLIRRQASKVPEFDFRGWNQYNDCD
jgi:hypothetical protein